MPRKRRITWKKFIVASKKKYRGVLRCVKRSKRSFAKLFLKKLAKVRHFFNKKIISPSYRKIKFFILKFENYLSEISNKILDVSEDILNLVQKESFQFFLQFFDFIVWYQKSLKKEYDKLQKEINYLFSDLDFVSYLQRLKQQVKISEEYLVFLRESYFKKKIILSFAKNTSKNILLALLIFSCPSPFVYCFKNIHRN